MNRKNLTVAAGVAFAALVGGPSMVFAQTVGAAQSFAIVGGQSVTAAAGPTQSLINGDVGVSPGTSITGFPANATTVPPYATHVNDGAAINAQAATLSLYNSLVALGPGTAIAAGTMLTVNIHIGAFVTVNRVCNISHDCRIGDFATIAPATNLSGGVEVGEGCSIGSGVTTVRGVCVGEWAIVGAGAAIAAPVPSNCTAVGVPARPIKHRESGWQLQA
jgi:acetyltransferase-like isoleucine patch superfamily enzyme